MIAVFLAPFYVAVNAYILIRILKSLGYISSVFKKKALQIPIGIIYAFLTFSPLIAFFLPYHTTSKEIVQLISSYWFGVIMYTLLVVVLGQLISVFLRRVIKVLPVDFFKKKASNLVCLLLSVAIVSSVCGWGIYNARDIKLNNYSVSIDKDAGGQESLKVVLIADLHLGYSIGLEHIQKTVELINSQNPDLVCIAGDIYDNDYDAISQPDAISAELAKIQSTYGTYACWGNHDVSEKILAGFTFDPGDEKHDSRMDNFLKNANINMLADESVLVDNKFYVVGRVDEEKPATENGKTASPEELLSGLDQSKPIIVIYHEPSELSELAQAGTDLLLCGHTHDGQVFPGNIITGLKWENSCGYLKKDDMHNIVTSGVGIWGPYMRVGTDSEVVSIDVTFTK